MGFRLAPWHVSDYFQCDTNTLSFNRFSKYMCGVTSVDLATMGLL